MTEPIGTRTIELTRVYAAPRQDVFALWTDAEHLARWWGPDGFTLSHAAFDPRPGGRWIFTMHGPDGTDFPNTVTYDDIVPGERLVYTHGEASDPDPTFTGVVTFDEVAGNTALSMRLVFESAAARDLVVEKYHADEGGAQTLGRLAALLETAVG